MFVVIFFENNTLLCLKIQSSHKLLSSLIPFLLNVFLNLYHLIYNVSNSEKECFNGNKAAVFFQTKKIYFHFKERRVKTLQLRGK